MKFFYVLSLFTGMVIFISCGSDAPSTENIQVVEQVNLDRYSGTWYEIARLPNRFEEGLINITATYTLRDDGSIKVLNRGYDVEEKEWREAEGEAEPVEPGILEVSFFWIFGSSYKIIALDRERYQWAMVTSDTKEYLWILNRSPRMDREIYDSLVKKARDWGFDVEKLIEVKQKPLD